MEPLLGHGDPRPRVHEMSKKGEQQNKKDGGALNGTHENESSSINCFSEDFRIVDNLNNLNENVDKSVNIQDGVIISDDNEVSSGLQDSLHFLNDEIDSYDRAVVENNTEWLKARCKGVDSGIFDMNMSSVSDTPLTLSVSGNPLSVSDVGIEMGSLSGLGLTTVPGLLSVEISSDKGKQTQTDEKSTENESLASMVSDTALTGDYVYLLQDDNGDQNILQSVSSMPLDTAQNTSMDSALSELSSSSDLGIDKEMFLRVNKALQPDDFQNEADAGHQDNVVVLSRDNFFTDSVGNNEGLNDSNMRLCIIDGVVSIVSPNTDKKSQDQSPILPEYVTEAKDYEEKGAKTSETQPISETNHVQNSKIVINPLQSTPETHTSEPKRKMLQPDFSVATISISNDKDSKQTKILVDTSQGQRLYQINIPDFLNQKVQKQETNPSTVIAIPYQEVKLNNQRSSSAQNIPSVVNSLDAQGTKSLEEGDLFLQ